MGMEQFLKTETLIIELLLVVSFVAMAVRRLRVPYTVALVVAGLIITFQQPTSLELAPTLILSLFVPPLVFEAALHLNLVEFRRNLPVIMVLAVPGVVITTLVALCCRAVQPTGCTHRFRVCGGGELLPAWYLAGWCPS